MLDKQHVIERSVIERGGGDPERLYLVDDDFDLPNGRRVVVKRTEIEGCDMDDLIARHRGRYYLVAFFCRPGHRVLDFPCGSGYAAEIVLPFGVEYDGMEVDEPTIEFARRQYGEAASFSVGDLRSVRLGTAEYEVIGCIEGLEHVEMEYQDELIGSFKGALKPGGTLVVSSPENPTGRSGRSEHNPYHLGELTRGDFLGLLHRHFPAESVELVTQRALLSTGVRTTCFYGICRHDGKT